MANLKEIRQRISSVKSTRQITSAMKMVSAAKLKKAQDAILQMRPYANKLNELIIQLSMALEAAEENQYSEVREINKVLLVVVSANRGLCGGFNANVVKQVIDLAETEYRELWRSGHLDIAILGKKGGEMISAKGFGQWPNHNDLLDKPSYEKSELFASDIMNKFIDGEYDKIDLVYNQFKNTATQVLTHETFLPIKIQKEGDENGSKPFYLFEPSLEYLLKELIPSALKTQVFKSILDSQAAEHGARMTAMHQATDNATELLRDLNLEYNKARQAEITSQLIEIIGELKLYVLDTSTNQ